MNVKQVLLLCGLFFLVCYFSLVPPQKQDNVTEVNNSPDIQDASISRTRILDTEPELASVAKKITKKQNITEKYIH